MANSFSSRTFILILSAIITVFSVLFFSCQKELTGDTGSSIPALPDFVTTVSSSVSGFVTDENDVVVSGASVSAGSSSVITDKYGFFEIKNVQVIKEAAVVTITRPGYFKAIKTYPASDGKSAFFRIKLIPKINAGNVDAAIGGSILLANGLNISIPSNGVVNAVTNTVYSGPVSVAAHWIDPTGNDLNRVMPGDLRGVDTAGTMKLLTTYGMAAVELTGSGGEILQIAPGKKASLTIPLPSAIAASAPSTIPLWYFDDVRGLWKQEGFAVKSGNNYIGDVSHFSFWNCDVPSNFVRFNCTVTNAKGVPVQNVLVKISVVNSPQSTGYGYTDSSGYSGGAVPGNAQLLLEVFGEYNCSTVLYSQSFSTTNVNVSLGNIKISPTQVANISGKIVNCSNGVVSNGFVLMVKGGISYHYKADITGAFDFSTTICAANNNVTFIGDDVTALQSGNPAIVTLVPGDNPVGTLVACGITTSQFVNYTINGTSYSLTASMDTIAQSLPPLNVPSVYIKAYSGVNGKGVYITFNQAGMALNSNQPLSSFFSSQITDSTLMLTPITVKITENGAIGQFLSGNFTGTFTGAPPANIAYNVTCSFRVRRRE